MPDKRAYYEGEYKDRQLADDLKRVDRLSPCFPEGIRGKKILSVGSGPGVDILSVVKGNEAHAVDISAHALKVAADNGFITHQVDLDATDRLPFEDGYFDIIVATDILEHLFDPRKILLEIHRSLKADGYAVLSVPNHFYLRRRVAILFGGGIVLPCHDSDEWDYFHIRFFTVGGWERLLSDSGFAIRERIYDFAIDVPWGLPHSVDRKLAKRFPGLFSKHFLCKCGKASQRSGDK
jgi:SAM-dependent methyltransferase